MALNCPLCDRSRWHVLWEDDSLFVIDAAEEDWPGFIRVVTKAHVKEMSDLSTEARHHLMDVVNVVERAVLDYMQAAKVNLAQLGNMVPHVHWHVIARFADDATFPDAIWAARKREPDAEVFNKRKEHHLKLLTMLPERLNSAFPADNRR